MMRYFHWLRTVVPACFLCLIVLSAPSSAETKPEFSSFITAHAVDNIPSSTPSDEFDCSDKIYIVIEVTAPLRQSPSSHKLLVNWYNPGGDIEQRTRYDFTSHGKGTRIWAWLRLSAPTGAAIAQVFDPAFGMGGFIGEWKASVLIDGDKLKTHQFNVLC